jgi:cold shock CspA family protein
MGTGGRGRGAVAKRATKRPVQKAIKKDPRAKKEDNTVDAGFDVDESERRIGKIDYFDKRRGFGFIAVEDGVVPENKLMVHWSEITSSDRWPFLTSGMEVEYSIKKVIVRQGKAGLLRACNVSMPGGEAIALQDEVDDKKEHIGGKDARYTGSIKWYHTTQGYGYIALDRKQAGVTDVKITREEVSGGYAIPLHQGLQVEFGLMKNKKGTISAFQVTLPGGEILTREAGEAREPFDGVFTGEIDWYDFRGAQGWILPDDFESLPAAVQESVTSQAQRRADRTGKETMETLHFRRLDMVDHNEKFTKGTAVRFCVYDSAKGAGAFDVQSA